MTNINFRSRLIAALPVVPADLDLNLTEFVQYEPSAVVGLARADAEILMNQGMPRDAPPFLSFYARRPDEITKLLRSAGLPDSTFPIGHNGSGDILAIDKESREVVYFNHDAFNQRIFINSSLAQFVECLCLFQEHVTRRELPQCLNAIRAVDEEAVVAGSMWHAEIVGELAVG